MKNKNRPFFYEKKKTPFWKTVLIFAVIAALLLFACMQVPSLRQQIAEPLTAVGSYIYNSAKTLFAMTRMYHEDEKARETYTPLELPDRQVLFAESLESLSAISQDDPLADLRQTPTPSEYSKVAEWEYLDPNLNYEVRSGGTAPSGEQSVQLIPPVFEHADLFNDGAAVLSACLRYWGIVENQYHIATAVHPDSFDPFISLDDMETFISNEYPQFTVFSKVNGDKTILLSLMEIGIPVIVPVMARENYSFWMRDDKLTARYFLILGYDSERELFTFQDAYRGNTLEMAEADFLADWYPFQRKYLLIYPEEKDSEVRDVLAENYFEELNLQKAAAKFRTDSELLPDNPFAQYNMGVMLHDDGDFGGAWELFEKAVELGLPQRFFNGQSEMLQTALELGYADDLDALIREPLDKNSHDEILTVYAGWAEILRGNYKEGVELFERAEKINPNSNTVIYALKYKDTMLNY